MKKGFKENIESSTASVFLETDISIIKESLKEDISDFDSYNQKKDSLIKRLNFLAKAIDNKANDERLLAKVAEVFSNGVKNKIERPISLLKEILAKNPSAVLYKNLDNLTNESIVEIIKDMNLVDLLEKLEKDDQDY